MNLKKIRGIASYIVNGKEILIVSDEWKGTPIIAHKPDYLLISRATLIKFRKNIISSDKLNIIEI